MEFFQNTSVRIALALLVPALIVAVTIAIRTRLRSRGRTIRIVGVGGGGVNALDEMIRSRISGVDYIAINTDIHALRGSIARKKIAIGKAMTNGRGAGGDPATGEAAAREAAEEIGRALAGSELAVIIAGLGGGTGSGAAPVVAELARQQGALTIAVVTKPFRFEGARRRSVAEGAAASIQTKADAVATVPNDRVREIVPADVTVEAAFTAIDEVLRRSVHEIVGLIARPGRITLDFADVRAVLKGGGAAVVGLGRAAGENRAVEAARKAMAATPLEGRMNGASAILLNVAGSRRLKLSELDAAADEVLATAAPDADLVFGMTIDRRLGQEVQVTLIATGIDSAAASGRVVAQSATNPQSEPVPWRPVWLRDRNAPPEAPQPEHVEAPPRRARRTAGHAGIRGT